MGVQHLKIPQIKYFCVRKSLIFLHFTKIIIAKQHCIHKNILLQFSRIVIMSIYIKHGGLLLGGESQFSVSYSNNKFIHKHNPNSIHTYTFSLLTKVPIRPEKIFIFVFLLLSYATNINFYKYIHFVFSYVLKKYMLV